MTWTLPRMKFSLDLKLWRAETGHASHSRGVNERSQTHTRLEFHVIHDNMQLDTSSVV